MADLRNKLKTASFRNQSLQDILKSCSVAIELISVEPYTGAIHNTKMTLKLNRGDNYPIQERYYERIHFYNRVNIARAIEGLTASGNTLSQIVESYNLQGCDFTEDDVELVSGTLKAKIDSLGYFNEEEVVVTGSDFAFASLVPGRVRAVINGTVYISLPLNETFDRASYEWFKNLGIALVDPHENLGCIPGLRYQNITNQVLDVELTALDPDTEIDEATNQPVVYGGGFEWDDSIGAQISPEDLYDNTYRYLTEALTLKFKLAPNKSYAAPEINYLDYACAYTNIDLFNIFGSTVPGGPGINLDKNDFLFRFIINDHDFGAVRSNSNLWNSQFVTDINTWLIAQNLDYAVNFFNSGTTFVIAKKDTIYGIQQVPPGFIKLRVEATYDGPLTWNPSYSQQSILPVGRYSDAQNLADVGFMSSKKFIEYYQHDPINDYDDDDIWEVTGE